VVRPLSWATPETRHRDALQDSLSQRKLLAQVADGEAAKDGHGSEKRELQQGRPERPQAFTGRVRLAQATQTGPSGAGVAAARLTDSPAIVTQNPVRRCYLRRISAPLASSILPKVGLPR
jgi:hypothetical protein